MISFRRSFSAPSLGVTAGTVAAVASFVAVTLVGVALAGAFTLTVAKSANVTSQAGATKRESIVVTSHGFAVYELTGDSRSHPECTSANSCFSFWPPVRVSSAHNLSKAPGIRGRLGVWHRDGFLQVTLGGHPLYRYAPDTQEDAAMGQGIQSFGGTWHVVPGSSGGASATSGRSGSSTSSGSSSPGIPQGPNAGDGDSDNHGAPSDGDGNR